MIYYPRFHDPKRSMLYGNCHSNKILILYGDRRGMYWYQTPPQHFCLHRKKCRQNGALYESEQIWRVFLGELESSIEIHTFGYFADFWFHFGLFCWLSATIICTLINKDIMSAISKLKNKKSKDSFNITPEQLKCIWCNNLINWLTSFYNYII